MGSCISCGAANEKREKNIPDIVPARPSSKSSSLPPQQNGDVNDNPSIILSTKRDAVSRQSSLSTQNGLSSRPHSGRQKKLSICSTYSGREKLHIPVGFPEDCILTVHDLFNILNDGSLTAYIHDEGNILLIDCREHEEYEQQHIVTARHTDELHQSHFQSGVGYSIYDMVIVYGNEINNDETGRLHSIWSEVSANVAGEVLVLVSGFRAFTERFPFMCTEKIIIKAWERKTLITYPSAIIDDKLYQGKGDQATNRQVLNDLKITHVINITKEHPNKFPDDIVYLRLAIDDEKKSNLKRHFEETHDFIANALKNGGAVFVHCNLGVSRSSTIVVAYLMKTNQISLEDALTFLRSRRSCARPNIGFLMQLSEWEAAILGSAVSQIDNL